MKIKDSHSIIMLYGCSHLVEISEAKCCSSSSHPSRGAETSGVDKPYSFQEPAFQAYYYHLLSWLIQALYVVVPGRNQTLFRCVF